jgi:hypothetical protein
MAPFFDVPQNPTAEMSGAPKCQTFTALDEPGWRGPCAEIRIKMPIAEGLGISVESGQ